MWSFRARRLAEASGAEEVAHCSLLFSGAPISGGGGGGETTLTPWTITELGGGAQSNIPIEVYVPFSAAGGAHPFLSTDAIKIYDADGVTEIPCQEDNRSSDLTPDVRGLKVTAILPAISSNQARQLTVKKVSLTTPTAGTDITTAEIVATGYDLSLSLAYKDGNTYTASAATAIAASGWSAKTAASNLGTWRNNTGGGGFVTEYVATCPLKNGGTSIANDLQVRFCISAYKAQRGAVSGGNPIIGIKTQYWIESGLVQESAAVNHWFDLTVTSGTNSQAWVGSSPAKTITLSGNTSDDYHTATVPTGGTTFTANSVGQVIADGTGSAVIVGYVSADEVEVYLSDTFASTTITSGTWRMWGINHQYASKLPQQELWYGGSPAITAKPNIDSTLGVAWNGGTLTGGPFDYFVATNWILPYTTAAADITNDMTNLNACGTNPTGWTHRLAGDIKMYMPETGGRGDIAPLPSWYVGGMIKAEANGKARIMGNGSKFSLARYHWRDQTTGKTTLMDNGVNYDVDSALPGTTLPRANAPKLTDWTWDTPHHPDCYFAPYLYTGDYYWADSLQQIVFTLWADCSHLIAGSQLNRLFCTASELRGNAWAFRDLQNAILVTPDRDPAVLGYTRSHLNTSYDNQFTATNSGTAGTNPKPGINIGLINNTGSGKVYTANGIRAMSQSPDTLESPWMGGYMAMALFQGKGRGMLSSHAQAFLEWWMEGLMGAALSSDVVTNWLVPSYRWVTSGTDGTDTYENDWAGVYKYTANDPTGNGLSRRTVVGTGITLSALTGAGITVTMPTDYFTNGGSWYVDGSIQDRVGASMQVKPLPGVTSVKDADAASKSATVPTNNGYVTVWNPSPVTIYISLSAGAGTASAADTAVASGATTVFTVGANTHINYISSSGSNRYFAVGGSTGTGYAVSDTITVAVGGLSGDFTESRAAQLTVATIGAGGEVTSVTVSDPGLFVATDPGEYGNVTNSLTQASTSGSGTGATFRVPERLYTGADDTHVAIQFGRAMITGVSGDVLTLTTIGSWASIVSSTVYCYGFAQTGLTSNQIRTSAPYPGDSNGGSGSGVSTYGTPVPYPTVTEFWDIPRQCSFMADLYGMTNGAAYKAALDANYTAVGGDEKWNVTPP